MWGRQLSRTAMLGLASILFVVCCVLPIAYLAAVSVTDTDGLARLILDSRQRQLLFNTCLLGLGTAFLGTLIGAPLGMAMARIPMPAKDLLRVALAAPVLVPPYIVGLAWTYASDAGGTVSWRSIGRTMDLQPAGRDPRHESRFLPDRDACD